MKQLEKLLKQKKFPAHCNVWLGTEVERECERENERENVCVRALAEEMENENVASGEEESVESDELGSWLVVKFPSHLRHPFALFISTPH